MSNMRKKPSETGHCSHLNIETSPPRKRKKSNYSTPKPPVREPPKTPVREHSKTPVRVNESSKTLVRAIEENVEGVGDESENEEYEPFNPHAELINKIA